MALPSDIVTTGDAGECVLCAAVRFTTDDRVSFVVHRGQHNYVILNRYPYTSGHVMVVPYAHVGTLEDLTQEAAAEMMSLTRDASRHLREIYHPLEGLNLGMNLGTEVRGRGARHRPSAHARSSALDRGHQFHHRDRRNACDSRST